MNTRAQKRLHEYLITDTANVDLENVIEGQDDENSLGMFKFYFIVQMYLFFF